MKTLIKLIAALLLLFIISGIGVYFYLPTFIAKSVVSHEGPGSKLMPAEVKRSINRTVDRIPATLEEQNLGITIEDIIEVLDKMTAREITTTIEILNQSDLKDEQHVLNIMRENIEWYQLDTEKTRKAALENLKMSDVNKTLKMIRENGKPYALTIPIAKETIKGVLIEKKNKIEQRIN